MIRKYGSMALTAPVRKKLKLSEFLGVNTTVAEENLPFHYSPKSYNFSLGKGVLDTGVGVSKIISKIGDVNWEIKKRSITAKFLKMFFYRTHSSGSTLDRLVAYGDDGHLYETALNVAYTTFTDIGSYGEILSAINYTYQGNSGLLFSTAGGLYFLYVNTVTRLSYSEIFTTMCAHNDRIFAVLYSDEYKLYFSDDFNPTNWNVSLQEGGYINFDERLGKIIKLVSFGGYVYIFFEHGIQRLNAYNDQTEFSVRQTYLSVGMIEKDTITVCGDRLMFASSDGVYSFDGVSVGKVLGEIADLFAEKQSASFAAFHGGKYYLACTLNMDSAIATGTNSLVIYDIWKKTHEIAHDIGIHFLLPIDTENFCGVITETSYPVSFLGRLDRSGSVNSTATYKLWCSPVTSLGANSGRKLLREMRIRTEGTVTFTVTLDGVNHSFTATSGLNVFHVMRQFDRLKVSISSTAATARVTKADLTVDFFGE